MHRVARSRVLARNLTQSCRLAKEIEPKSENSSQPQDKSKEAPERKQTIAERDAALMKALEERSGEGGASAGKFCSVQ